MAAPCLAMEELRGEAQRAQMEALRRQLDATVAEHARDIQARDATIAEQAETIQARDATVAEQNSDLADKTAQCEQMAAELHARRVTPEEYKCSITLNLMRDPVVTADGHTYEREAIQRWFRINWKTRNKSPFTGARLQDRSLRPNIALRKLIDAWREQGTPAESVAGEAPPDEQPEAAAGQLPTRIFETGRYIRVLDGGRGFVGGGNVRITDWFDLASGASVTITASGKGYRLGLMLETGGAPDMEDATAIAYDYDGYHGTTWKKGSVIASGLPTVPDREHALTATLSGRTLTYAMEGAQLATIEIEEGAGRAAFVAWTYSGTTITL